MAASAVVYDTSRLCPLFFSLNSNAFASTFGIKFAAEDTTFIRPVLAYEVACWFRLDEDLTHVISHPTNFCLLDCRIPAMISCVILDTIVRRLEKF